jgi:hypothetical protein
MQKIRTIKPELARHELLFDLEHETGLPIRFAWAMLFTCCDREGRFKWRPRVLKTMILPYDDVDFGRILDAWVTRGLVVKYEVGGEVYGCIPTWHRHQVINNREAASEIPASPQPQTAQQVDASATRDSRVSNAISAPLGSSPAEGNGTERNGTEGSGNGRRRAIVANPTFESENFVAKLRDVWPRPDFGHASEIAAMEALEDEMRETALTEEAAAHNIIARIAQVADIVSSWPRDELNKLPGLTTLLRTRRYKQDDVFWQRLDSRQAKADERQNAIKRLVEEVS